MRSGGSYSKQPDGTRTLVERPVEIAPRGPRAPDGEELDTVKVVRPNLPEIPPMAESPAEPKKKGR